MNTNNKIFDKFLTTEYQVIAQNVRLDDLQVIGAAFQGGWIWGADPLVKKPAYPTNICRVRNDGGDELQVQLQSNYDEYLKVVHVTFRQNGRTIEAKADWAAWAYQDENHGLGHDFTSDRANSAPIATRIGGDGYGISELVFVDCAGNGEVESDTLKSDGICAACANYSPIVAGVAAVAVGTTAAAIGTTTMVTTAGVSAAAITAAGAGIGGAIGGVTGTALGAGIGIATGGTAIAGTVPCALAGVATGTSIGAATATTVAGWLGIPMATTVAVTTAPVWAVPVAACGGVAVLGAGVVGLGRCFKWW